jgi:hypothetical protein
MQSGECKYETDAGTKFTTIEQTPFFNNELWFDKDTNLYTYENNINVFNNGGVALQGPHHEGHMLCIVLGHWRVKRDNSPGVGIWNVGIHGEARDRWGDIVADVTEFTQLTAGPGEIATATLDFGIISEEVHSVNLFYETETVQAANTEYFWCNADVNIGVRSIVDA